MIDQLLDMWQIHQRINLYLLDAVPNEALLDVPTGLKGRSICKLFAHIHNVRVLWLDSQPDRKGSVQKLAMTSKADEAALTKDVLREALETSSAAIADLLQVSFEQGKIKNFKPHPAAFLGYLISHESYHRGEICMTLTEAGHPLDDKILYGQWEWGVR
jgi:uncharacterized damage-inducible protein DinB